MSILRKTRVVTAPEPSVPANQLPPNRPLSVTLTESEDVEWIWSSLANGQQYVSGYKIVKAAAEKDKR